MMIADGPHNVGINFGEFDIRRPIKLHTAETARQVLADRHNH
jgi:hypothetical protein